MDKATTFEEVLAKNGRLVYTNTGISMLPLIRQGKDAIEIVRRPEGRVKKYDAVLYKVGTRYVLHRVIKVREHSYDIVGDNCITIEKGITDSQIIGVLASVNRGGKRIYATDIKYRFYAHLVCDLYPVKVVIVEVCKLFRKPKKK